MWKIRHQGMLIITQGCRHVHLPAAPQLCVMERRGRRLGKGKWRGQGEDRMKKGVEDRMGWVRGRKRGEGQHGETRQQLLRLVTAQLCDEERYEEGRGEGEGEGKSNE